MAGTVIDTEFKMFMESCYDSNKTSIYLYNDFCMYFAKYKNVLYISRKCFNELVAKYLLECD